MPADIRLPGNDDELRRWRDEWAIRPDTIYLNHGSFGPTPRSVRDCQLKWQAQLASQPMDFFVRNCEAAWLAARKRLAEFVGTDSEQPRVRGEFDGRDECRGEFFRARFAG